MRTEEADKKKYNNNYMLKPESVSGARFLNESGLNVCSLLFIFHFLPDMTAEKKNDRGIKSHRSWAFSEILEPRV